MTIASSITKPAPSVLIIGQRGQLGNCLLENAPSSISVTGVDINELDITNRKAVERLIFDLRPSWIINAAAYTAVDQAEDEPELAHAVNVGAVEHIAKAARSVGARVIHISTDFVFSGDGSTPYHVDDQPAPLSVYGNTKLEGEQKLLEIHPGGAIVVRTAWLYSEFGGNFVKSMLRLMEEKAELSVVSDQSGTPTYAGSLALALWSMVERCVSPGVYHWTDGGETSWFAFACEIQRQAFRLGVISKLIPIHPITTSEYPSKAVRPRYSVLNCDEARESLAIQVSPWEHNLQRVLLKLHRQSGAEAA